MANHCATEMPTRTHLAIMTQNKSDACPKGKVLLHTQFKITVLKPLLSAHASLNGKFLKAKHWSLLQLFKILFFSNNK